MGGLTMKVYILTSVNVGVIEDQKVEDTVEDVLNAGAVYPSLEFAKSAAQVDAQAIACEPIELLKWEETAGWCHRGDFSFQRDAWRAGVEADDRVVFLIREFEL